MRCGHRGPHPGGLAVLLIMLWATIAGAGARMPDASRRGESLRREADGHLFSAHGMMTLAMFGDEASRPAPRRISAG